MRSPRVCVFAPSPLLTVTIEAAADPTADEVHVHAGGQGLWIARLLVELGADVVLCGAFGGEAGRLARILIEGEAVRVRAVEMSGTNGAYVHDRRSGERVEQAMMHPAVLNRHEVDELYDVTLVEALDADVTVLSGPGGEPVIPAGLYGRFAGDVRGNGGTVVADLANEPLREVIAAGVDVLKVSHEELRLDAGETPQLLAAMDGIVARGARAVIVTRAAEPALAVCAGELYRVTSPQFAEQDHHGSGDSLTAGVALCLAAGRAFEEGLRLGAAAGAMNVTRRGLGSSGREEIERLAKRVIVERLGAARPEVTR